MRTLCRHALSVAAALAWWSACGGPASRQVSVLGSTSIQPFADRLAEQYGAEHPGAFVEVQGGGSTAGLQAAENGLADLGMCSRALTPAEARIFTPVIVARDGLAIVVNRRNPIHTLALPQLRGIFSGAFSDWSQVGGKAGPIRPISREEGSGTRESFMRLVMAGSGVSRRALTQESNGAVMALVMGDPAAIGYLSLGLVTDEIRAVQVDGIAPTRANVLAGRYLLVRPLLFVTHGTPSAAARAFVAYVLSDPGQRLLEAEGLVRAP
jgi:phosphate transport system substrate-binding protein